MREIKVSERGREMRRKKKKDKYGKGGENGGNEGLRQGGRGRNEVK